MSCKIHISRHNDLDVVKITGEISGEDSGRISRKILTRTHQNTRAVVIDLRETTFLDSHGLGALIYIRKMLDDAGSNLVLLDPPQFVHTLMQGTNLDSVITIADSLDSI
jgi:anti-anti-sigma factor